MQDAVSGTVLDVTVPPGAYNAGTRTGWKVLGSGWQYRNALGLQGLTKLTVKRAASGLLTVSAIAKNGSFPVAVGQLPAALHHCGGGTDRRERTVRRGRPS